MKSSDDNFYRTLGVHPQASQHEIKKAFRRLALEFHPDRNPSSEAAARFRKIAQAYERLSDSKMREDYDLQMRRDKSQARTKKSESGTKPQKIKEEDFHFESVTKLTREFESTFANRFEFLDGAQAALLSIPIYQTLLLAKTHPQLTHKTLALANVSSLGLAALSYAAAYLYFESRSLEFRILKKQMFVPRWEHGLVLVPLLYLSLNLGFRLPFTFEEFTPPSLGANAVMIATFFGGTFGAAFGRSFNFVFGKLAGMLVGGTLSLAVGGLLGGGLSILITLSDNIQALPENEILKIVGPSMVATCLGVSGLIGALCSIRQMPPVFFHFLNVFSYSFRDRSEKAST